MLKLPKINSSDYTDLNKVIGWFISLRWVASAGVFIAILIAHYHFRLDLPYNVLVVLNVLLVLINLMYTLYFSVFKQKNLSPNEMSLYFNIQICSDYGLLFLLIYFAGLFDNPFSYYFVFHIMLTSFIFSSRVVMIYVSVLLVFLLGVILAIHSNLLPHYLLVNVNNSTGNELLLFQVVGLFSTIIFTAYMVTSIKKRLEERGNNVEVELNHYKSLDKTKSDFILQVTHELRGPIAATMGYHEMILKGISGNINKQTEELTRKANRRTENLLNIIDEMLDYAYIKSDEEVKTKLTRIQVKPIIDYNLDLYFNMASDKGIKLISNCSKDLMVLANRDLLNIIFSNLLSNSIKYSINESTVTINASGENEKVHLLFKDEGIGIESDNLKKVFDEFYRTRRARELEKDGTGLGLPIVKKAVERLHGEVSIYSEEENGTTFHIYLPRHID